MWFPDIEKIVTELNYHFS